MSNLQQFFKRLLNRPNNPEEEYIVEEDTVHYRNIHDVEPPIYTAIRYNKLDDLELILQDGADINCVHAGAETTPLHIACDEDNLEALKLLVQYGGCVNITDVEGGATPLLVAATVGNVEIVRYLLDNGANINSFGDQSPPHVAAHDCQQTQLDFPDVLDAYQQNTALIQACRECHIDVIKLLLDRGCDVNLYNQNGNTALHVACLGRTFYPYPTEHSRFIPSTFFRRPDPYIVGQLLRYGAHMNLTNYLSHTPLQRLFLIRSSFHLRMTGWAFSRKENNDIILGLFRVIHCLLEHGCNLPSRFSGHLRPHTDPWLSQELLTTVKFAENFGLTDPVYPVILNTMVFSLDNGCQYSVSEVAELTTYDPQYELLTDTLLPLVASPRPLKSLCRQFLRCYLYSVHCGMKQDVLKDLTLPPALAGYLMGQNMEKHSKKTAESDA